MYLSRVEIDTENRQKLKSINSQDAYHNWVEQCFPKELQNNKRTRKLWRIDELKNKKYLLIVSETKPDLEKMETYGVKNTAQTLEYDSFLNTLKNGMKMKFRVALNPVKSISNRTTGRGKVVPHITIEHQNQFLYERAEKNGFKLKNGEFNITNRQYKRFNKNRNKEKRNPIRLVYVEYEGILEITEINLFKKALIKGIGKKKAYGFGMMTVIPYE